MIDDKPQNKEFWDPITGEHWVETLVWKGIIGSLMVAGLGIIIALIVLQVMIVVKG